MSSTGVVKKKLSGAEFKKKRQRIQKEIVKQKDSMKAFLIPNQVSPGTSHPQVNSEKIVINEIPEQETSNFQKTTNISSENASCVDLSMCLNDPALWPVLTEKVIQLIVEKGPVQINNVDFNFPVTNKRKFNIKFFNRSLSNGESVGREWLVYSKSKDVVFCFCCKLFSKTKNNISLSSVGNSDWNHLNRMLKEHEGSIHHMDSFRQWKNMAKGLKTGATVDSDLQRQLSKEVQHWRDVLKRLLIFVQYLGSQNLAFRGKSDTLYSNDNGNFLKLVESVSKFDPTLTEHLRRIRNAETQTHYLSNDIQNELIQILSSTIRNKILADIKNSKYFSLIVDCTPDISHQEQMTLMIRVVSDVKNEYCIKEYFLGFLNVCDTTGLGLTEAILQHLEKLDILINNCRGQGYDNGSNMKGKNSGVQARIRALEPRAFFVPCAAHCLNLVVSDSAKCSARAVAFFDTVQALYVYFSASPSRWAVLKKYLVNSSVKEPSCTRWESRIEALKPLAKNLGDIYEALVELSQTGDAMNKHTAECLGNKIANYEFICCTLIWLEVLEKINVASKYLQSSDVSLPAALNILKTTENFLVDLRNETKFLKFLEDAKNISESLEIPIRFSNSSGLRSRRKKTFFEYESSDEVIMNLEHRFKVEFYYKILDQAIMSIRERYGQLEDHLNNFNFLYKLSPITLESEASELLENCKKLELILSRDGSSDINSLELYNELKMLSSLIAGKSPLDTLNFIKKNSLEGLFPNAVISLKILLTLPVTVASGERSFSKLKIIKNYLRSTMGQERLVGLATISIEKELLDDLDYDDLINDFAKIKARKINFNH